MSAVDDHNNGECGRWCPVCLALDEQDEWEKNA